MMLTKSGSISLKNAFIVLGVILIIGNAIVQATSKKPEKEDKKPKASNATDFVAANDGKRNSTETVKKVALKKNPKRALTDSMKVSESRALILSSAAKRHMGDDDNADIEDLTPAAGHKKYILVKKKPKHKKIKMEVYKPKMKYKKIKMKVPVKKMKKKKVKGYLVKKHHEHY